MSNAEHPPAQPVTPADTSVYDGVGKRRGRARRRHTVAKVLLSSMLVLAMVTGLGVTFLYRHLNGNLNVVNVDDQLGDDRPDPVKVEGPKNPINILVMGSDTREGEGNAIDGETAKAGLSDTTILMHLSADRKEAYGVSVPRDTLVERPDCIDEDGKTIPGSSLAQWNAAFALGGPACTIHQFESVTGVRVDNYVVVDFNGFQGMVDAIDGVEVCIPETIDDNDHDIHLEAGTRKLEGKEALAYVRARYRIGDGSDIGRIKRQQAFVAAMANKVVSGDTLARVDRLIGFLDAATQSLTTDIENIGKMARIGYEFKDVGLNKIQFVTAPFQYSTAQPGRVELTDQADGLWQKIINDAPLGSYKSTAITAGEVPGSKESGSGGSGKSNSPSGGASSSDGASPSDGASSDGSSGSGGNDNSAALAAAGLCT